MLCFWCSNPTHKSSLVFGNGTKESIENKQDNIYDCIDNDEHTLKVIDDGIRKQNRER